MGLLMTTPPSFFKISSKALRQFTTTIGSWSRSRLYNSFTNAPSAKKQRYTWHSHMEGRVMGWHDAMPALRSPQCSALGCFPPPAQSPRGGPGSPGQPATSLCAQRQRSACQLTHFSVSLQPVHLGTAQHSNPAHVGGPVPQAAQEGLLHVFLHAGHPVGSREGSVGGLPQREGWVVLGQRMGAGERGQGKKWQGTMTGERGQEMGSGGERAGERWHGTMTGERGRGLR